MDPTGHEAASGVWGQSILGALVIALETIDPLPLDPAAWSFGLGLIASDLLWQVYGPQLPSFFDKLGEECRNLKRTVDESARTGDPGRANPNDPNRPFRDLAEQYQ